MCGRYVVNNPVTKTSKLVKSAIQVEDIENSVDEILSNKYFIIDVFPAPDGAEKMMSFPSILRAHLKVVL